MAAARALTLAVGVQSLHFAEEAATGFRERFGAVFDLPGMPLTLFLVFNLTWLGIWVASIPGQRSARVSFPTSMTQVRGGNNHEHDPG